MTDALVRWLEEVSVATNTNENLLNVLIIFQLRSYTYLLVNKLKIYHKLYLFAYAAYFYKVFIKFVAAGQVQR